MHIKKIFSILAVFAIPMFVFAQTPLDDLVGVSAIVLNIIVPAVSLLVVLYFFWGLAKYVLSAGDPEKAAEGKSIMIWGVLAMFVLVSIWGIIGFIQKTTGTDVAAPQNVNIELPSVVGANVI